MQDLILKGPKVEDHVSMGFGEYFWLTAEKFENRIFQVRCFQFVQMHILDIQPNVVLIFWCHLGVSKCTRIC